MSKKAKAIISLAGLSTLVVTAGAVVVVYKKLHK